MRNPMRYRPDPVKDGGFTLLELLVVLAILGLLAAFAAPPMLRYLSSAKISTANIQISNLSNSLDLFKLDVGRYPTTEEGLDSLLSAPPGVDQWHGPYVKDKASLTDPWGHPYRYQSPGKDAEFDLSTAGPDGTGTAGK